MSKNPLTLLITIHSQFESVIFFHTLIKRSGFDKKKVMFAFDCNKNDIPSNIIDILEKESYSFYCPDENIGKLWLVIKATSLITTPYFKIIDQDDSLYLDDINIIEKQINNLNEFKLVRHEACKINRKSKLFYQTDNKEKILEQIEKGYNPNFIQGTNCDTIYPTAIINEMNGLNITRQEFHNDILLSNYVLLKGIKIENIFGKFYIQFHMNGQTKSISQKRSDCIPELYLNYKTIIEQVKEADFRNIMNNSRILHYIYISNFTTWYLKGNLKSKGKENKSKSLKILKSIYKL